MTTDKNKSPKDSNDSVSSISQASSVLKSKHIRESYNARPPKYGKIPATVWQIGMVMLLMNMSHVMMYSFSALYLKYVFGASLLGIGFIEGICEAMSNGMKLVSGMLSDFFKKRKGIVVFGYIFSLLCKFVFALSSLFALTYSAKALERFGNGVLASPRDAMVADVAPRKRIGASYGLKRSLGYTGSLLGGVFGYFAMQETNNDYRFVFAIALIPAIAAILLLIFFVKEPNRFEHPAITSEVPMPTPKLKPKFALKNFKYLGKYFWILMIVNAIFMMARMNESFLILRMNDGIQTDPKFGAIVMIVLNLGSTLFSYPIGLLGDRLNRVKILFLGVILLMLGDIVMYSATVTSVMYLGIFLWGAQIGLTQNIFISLIAEKVPEDLRGTGIGVYWLINAISLFTADAFAGYVAHSYSLNSIFISSGIIGLIALSILAMFINFISPPAGRSTRS